MNPRDEREQRAARIALDLLVGLLLLAVLSFCVGWVGFILVRALGWVE